MKNHLFSLIVLVLVLASCKSKEEPPVTGSEPQAKVDSPAVKNYLPVLDFIKAEIRNVDSFFAGIKKITIRDGKVVDSSFITADEFHKMTSEFVINELSKEYLQEHYDENSFLDNSTQAVTFTYSSLDHQLPIKRIDLLTGDVNGVDKMKSLFVEKVTSSGDTTVIKRLLWKAGKNFNLITQRSVGQLQPQVTHVKVVWDESQ